MCTLKIVTFILSATGFLCGLRAAYLWWKAGKYSASPAWKLELPRDVPNKSENDVFHNNIIGWVTGIMVAFKESGDLNRRAAIWTAITAGVTAFSSLLSVLVG